MLFICDDVTVIVATSTDNCHQSRSHRADTTPSMNQSISSVKPLSMPHSASSHVNAKPSQQELRKNSTQVSIPLQNSRTKVKVEDKTNMSSTLAIDSSKTASKPVSRGSLPKRTSNSNSTVGQPKRAQISKPGEEYEKS